MASRQHGRPLYYERFSLIRPMVRAFFVAHQSCASEDIQLLNPCGSDPFFSRANMVALALQYRVEGVSCWGVTGPHASAQIEAELDLSLPYELRDFATHVGNVSIGSLDVVVTGLASEGASVSNCVTRTLRARRKYGHLSMKEILLLETPSDIYCCEAVSGNVVGHPGIDFPGDDVTRWHTLREWILWLFPYERHLEELGDEFWPLRGNQ